MTTHLPDPSLERALGALTPHLDFPAPVDVRAAVLTRIRGRDATVQPLVGRRWWQPAVAAAFVLVLVSALVLTALPQARRAVADLLGFDDLRIEVVERPVPELGRDLRVGRAVTRAEALRLFGVVPALDPSVHSAPRRIYLSESGFMLSVVYGESAELPSAARDGVSLLITAHDGDLHPGFGEKVVMSGEASVRPVEVRGMQGYWVRGDHAFFVYTTTNGIDELESSRIANDVLVWEERGVILRIEGLMTRSAAIAFAEALVLET